jgi:hypothetical protein
MTTLLGSLQYSYLDMRQASSRRWFEEARHHARPAGARVFLGRGFGSAGDPNTVVPAITRRCRIEHRRDHAPGGHQEAAFATTDKDKLTGLSEAQLAWISHSPVCHKDRVPHIARFWQMWDSTNLNP